MILDCDFCDTAEHFPHRSQAVEEGWNWMDYEYEDQSKLQTVACPEHDASKVKELQKKKDENLTYSENSKPSKTAQNDRNQRSLKQVEPQ